MEKYLLAAESFTIGFKELRIELSRKAIHMLIAFIPILASFNKGFALALLGAGAIIYSYSEIMRAQGVAVALISGITELALRERDRNRFAAGPVTLAFGAMAALLFYPMHIAEIAIYALAFGDGFASVAGKIFGSIKIPVTGKTLEGSFACFLAVFFTTFRVSANTALSVAVAFVTTIIEALPLGDYDNIAIPIAAGSAAIIML